MPVLNSETTSVSHSDSNSVSTSNSKPKLRLKEIARWMEARFEGEDKIISGIAIDSRTLSDNELFFALVGERVNGHDYIEEVTRRQAAGIVISQPVESLIPQLYVKDTRLALGQLGKHYRDQFKMPMAAITGSYGKTTVKEMLASILSVAGPGFATRGNLNTEIGVPLTLLQLTEAHQWAVIEMGARKIGDIAYLMEIAKPTVALINNAGIAHIEMFGSENAVRNAKGELFSSLSEEGTAVINIEDPHLPYWKSLLKGQNIFSFGSGSLAQLRLSKIQYGSESSIFKLSYQNQEIMVTLFAPGEHNVRNAMGAAATALAMGASLASVKVGLEKFRPVSGRLQFITGISNLKIIDDTYNANPVSMRAALSVLASQPGQKFFVMGDMLELGKYAESWHQDIGEEAKRLGIHKMYGIGKLTMNAIIGFGDNGKHYEDKKSLMNDLINDIKEIKDIKDTKQNGSHDVTVLVKGSRGMRMEEVVSVLQNPDTILGKLTC